MLLTTFPWRYTNYVMRLRALPVVLSITLTTAAAADVYRWTDQRGEVHYSNVPEDAPAGAEVERLPGGSPAGPGAPVGAGPADAASGSAQPTGTPAPAGLDVDRFQLQHRYREAKRRLTDTNARLAALAAAQKAAPEASETAERDMEERDTREIALSKERDALTAQIDGIRASYADLCRRAAATNDGKLPVGWTPELE